LGVKASKDNAHCDANGPSIDRYLSDEHVAAPASGCPLAALSRDAAFSGVEVGAAYGRGVERTIAVLAAGMEGTALSRRRRALRLLSMLIGAVSLARCASADTRPDILLSTRQGAAQIMAATSN
jgi:TetR/AcrR family transcriptional repressor of nem operon